jgi:WD40 repeat protein
MSSAFAQKAELVVPAGHTAWVTDYAVSTRGKYLVTGSYSNTVKLWDFASKREAKTLYGHKNFVSAVAISKDENLIASAAWDGIVKLWNVHTGTFLKK